MAGTSETESFPPVYEAVAMRTVINTGSDVRDPCVMPRLHRAPINAEALASLTT